MKPFFVFSHLGLDIDFWDALISSHKRIQSNYSNGDYRIYENSNLEELTPKVSKWYFSKAKWYDILLHNYQIGHKDIYKNYPAVIIFGSANLAQNNLINHRIMDKSFAKTYTKMRMDRLLYICKQAIQPLVFVDGFSPVIVMKQMLADYLNIPYEYEGNFDMTSRETIDLKLLEDLYDLDLAGKIKLAVQ